MEGVFVLPNSPLTLSIQLEAVDNTDLLKAEERLWLKADILRRTLLVEWLTISDIRSIPPPDSELLNWQRWQRGFWLNAHLQNVRLGKDTLAQMEILRAPGPLSPEFSSFPNWRLLLPELQEKILDWLTSPTDKLNVLEAYPKAAGVMGKKWKSAFALRFEVNFSRQFGEHGTGLSWFNWQLMQMFRTMSPEFRSVINEQFEEHLKTGGGEYNTNLRHLLRRNCDQRWGNMDPITCLVYVHIGDERVEEGEVDALDMLTERDYENGLQRLEEWIGPRSWHCCFNYTGESISPVEFLQRMSQCLEKMPSLRKMVVKADMEAEWDNDWNVNQHEVENVSFPNLPLLHSLVLSIQNSDYQLTLIRTKLMQRYAAQLNRLQFTYNNDDGWDFFPVDFQHQPEFPAFPHLTIWKCTCSNSKDQGWGWDLHCDLLQKLVGSPLKSTHFTVNVSAGEKGFSDLLNVLGKGFGGTLEELSIKAKTPAGQQIQASWKRQSGDKWKDNLVNVAFPKLKHLKMNVDPCPEGWEFVLLFPSLEKLTFSFSRNDQVENGQADREDSIVELSSDLEAMRQANVWKLFPNLQEIERKQEVINFRRYETLSGKITRDEVTTAAAAAI